MVRTTINLDPTVLEELKKRAAREHKTPGELASLLLAKSLRAEPLPEAKPLAWPAKRMGRPAIDLDDREALWEFLDRETLGALRDVSHD
jgi:hypothetical protein